jgi:hypothetical protein
MDPEACRIIDNNKFMWDVQTFEQESEARSTAAEYEEKGFQVHVLHEQDAFCLYTRKEVVAETPDS